MFIPFAIETDRQWEFRQERPYTVYALLVLYVGIHAYLSGTLTPQEWADVLYRFGVVKSEFAWYSFITCTFLHVGWLHLIGNCFFLWIYGSTLERFLGSGRFLLVYLAGALVSIAVHLETLPPFFAGVPTVGASGAISSVLGAFLAVLPKARLRCVFFFFIRPFIVTLPAAVVLGLWFLGQLYFSLEPVSASEEVAFWAHVAGFASGAFVGALMYGRLHRGNVREELQRSTALARAWESLGYGDVSAAQQYHEAGQYGADVHEPATRALVEGMICAETDGVAEDVVREHLYRAYRKASNALEYSTAVTAYLSIRRRLPVRSVPARMHRGAGIAAASCKQPELALLAFADALQGGLGEGVPVLLRRTEAILRNKLGLDAQADVIRQLADQYSAGENGLD